MTSGPTDGERLRARGVTGERSNIGQVTGQVMRQVWRHLGFLHWPIAIDAIAPLLPPGLSLDTFDGVAYIGVVPFTIPLSRTPRLGMPVAPAFHELNLRTYVHRAGRDPGVWFFSLDATSRLAVAGARLAYHLPYFYARIGMEISKGPSIAYRASRSRSPAGGLQAEFSARYAPTGPVALAEVGSLEFFLAERYLLYSWNGRALSSARVHHAPYPLQPAVAFDVRQSLSGVAGLPPMDAPPPLVHYARDVDVLIERPRRVQM